MTLPDGLIKSNCPACLEPAVLWFTNPCRTSDNVAIHCTCGFSVVVPQGPNPAQSVALEIIGANELGECQEGDRRLIVHEGEAMDVIPVDAVDPPAESGPVKGGVDLWGWIRTVEDARSLKNAKAHLASLTRAYADGIECAGTLDQWEPLRSLIAHLESKASKTP